MKFYQPVLKSTSLALALLFFVPVAHSDPVSDVVAAIGVGEPINVAWTETVDGDLARTYRSLDIATLNLLPGLNIVSGDWFFRFRAGAEPSQKDLDSFNFTVPWSAEVSKIAYGYDVTLDENVDDVTISQAFVWDLDCFICDPGGSEVVLAFSREPRIYFCEDAEGITITCPWEYHETVMPGEATSPVFASDVKIFDFHF